MTGLRAFALYNGTTSIVQSYNKDLQRFEVQCEYDGAVHAIKADNLASYAHPPGDAKKEYMNLESESEYSEENGIAGMYNSHFQNINGGA